jgi:hypothetical protein
MVATDAITAMNAVSDSTVLWWISIGIGVVVVVCVIVLLALLTEFVKDIDRRVDVVAVQLINVVGNTGTSPHVHETARLVEALGVEVGEHVRALS